MKPKPMVTARQAHTNGLVRSIHSSIDKVSAVRIKRPPIVGVPRLAR